MSSPVVVTRIQNRRGTQDQFNALYPPGYNGIGGFGSIIDFNLTNYPEVLLAGEMALCTDSRKIFLGNINGEYLEVQGAGGSGGLLNPIRLELPPVGSFTLIPELTFDATPFFRLQYDLTDNLSADWNDVGTSYSRNGDLMITATAPFTPIPNPPFPDTTPVTLSDTGTEINLVIPNDISFMAQYNIANTQIEIYYMHNFADSLVFNTSTIKWSAF